VITYPDTLPCVSRAEGFTQDGLAGVVRSPAEAGASRQRRAFENLPHRLSLTFVMAQEELADFVAWVNANAWDRWVALALPGIVAARAGTTTARIPVRFTSDLSQEFVAGDGLWFWRVRVEAEWRPSAVALSPAPFGGWVVGGTPGAPSSPDWIIAGRPPTPSNAHRILAGTPAAPSGWL